MKPLYPFWFPFIWNSYLKAEIAAVEESLNEALLALSCPTCGHVLGREDYLTKLMHIEITSPLLVELFPKQDVLDYIRLSTHKERSELVHTMLSAFDCGYDTTVCFEIISP